MLEVAGEKCELSFFFFFLVENGNISTCLHASGNAADEENNNDAEAGGGILERSPWEGGIQCTDEEIGPNQEHT